jgi:tripartite-type tricarboxylate transporter receptor subunit TctC
MECDRRRMLYLAAGAAAIPAVATGALCESARSQTAQLIRFVVPFGPGTSIDLVARLMADHIGQSQGQTIVVENRLGAGTIVATEAVAGAVPDGSTLLFVPNPFVINPHLRKVNYDPFTSFEPICQLVNAPNLILVNATSPYRTLDDLIAAAKKTPGALTLAAVGPGSASQIAFEMLKRDAQIDMTFVPYQGTLPAIGAMLGDHVTSVFTAYSDVIDQVNSRKVRPLAVASASRIMPLSDVPTVAESGYVDIVADLWYGVVAPAQTAKKTLTRLGGWFNAALQSPAISEKLLGQGLFPAGGSGAEFGSLMRRYYDDYGRIIREANMKID